MDINTQRIKTDVLVIGGGTAGTMAGIKAKQANPDAEVLILEKANIRRSGAIAMGMDGVNTAVIPGHSTPEQYVREITLANDGILNQKAVYQTGKLGYEVIQELESWGVKFQKDVQGNYDLKQVHRVGKYVLPMPEGKDLKTILTRQVKRHKVKVTNRVMATRVLVKEGRAVGAVGFDVRNGDYIVIQAKAVILCTGACGRLGLPASGYLYGTYENPTNAGDGYSMAYHAGAELSNIECFQVNPLIKDYNGPACAYVAGPFGAHTANAEGNRFISCDYWSGQMMLEIWKELNSGKGPVQLKMTHLDEDTIAEIESILWANERPSRERFHQGRNEDYRTHGVEMHISEIGLCSGHSASGVWVNENAQTTVPGLYAAGDMASVPHNYMIGAFVFGRIAGTHAIEYIQDLDFIEPDVDFLETEKSRIYAPLTRPNGVPHTQVEYKLRRLVNDYLQPPKTGNKIEIGLKHFVQYQETLDLMGARDPHELMRSLEVHFIRDCAEMAARASLYRQETRWGLYHYRLDYPEKNDEEWFCHVNLKKDKLEQMVLFKRPVEPYIVEVDAVKEVYNVAVK
ncbi:MULTISPECIES: fumarate reductase/succinate dehydrogenase flavoprotein subunit [unclassified Nostoc]|uniref:fumarate reductase/succinate dehydrogenase flavoprotein subunit n=1 Tax=unclassified Nostoc TaxID=2593658 RepID=UPI0013D21B22|nr:MULTISPECIES: fumarate reductase/succinate dehydrogenase flavoprotein subunit [unclassified Nostoc]MBE9001933.1 fumarate reductase/succinate dehydrogenase flavoprotein subunit [Nostoc sp. LEGE 12447]NEU79403.1 fumarate reductase/succinate dehydrogenase flavoprotein subunit [Nostoc sp. UIC 10630]